MKLLAQFVATLLCVVVITASQKHQERLCKHIVSPRDITYRVGMRHHDIESAEDHRIEKRAPDQPFRMFVHYDSSVSNELTASLETKLKNIVNKMKDYFERALYVRRTTQPLLFERDCSDWEYLPPEPGSDDLRCNVTCKSATTCGETTIPEDHLKACIQCNGSESTCQTEGNDGSGVVNSDFVLYVSAVSNDTYDLCDTSIAFAAVCQMERDYDRPIAGYANFCPQALETTDDVSLLAVAKHEVLHVLAFANELYAWWRDENGEPRTPRDSNGYPPQDAYGDYVASTDTVQTVTYTDWETRTGAVNHSVTMLVTPRILQEARNHFNCSTLEGMELENNGGSETALKHWEKRLVENEAMTGSISVEAVTSRLTFALLEDSGWYTVDYSKAEQLLWGRYRGCEFATKSCGGFINSHKQQNRALTPFCNHLFSEDQVGCSRTRSAPSVCNLYYYDYDLPAEYQYFQSGPGFNSSNYNLSQIGGFVELADYCPYQPAYADTICYDPANIYGTGIGFNNPAAQSFGSKARCVEQGNLPWNVSNSTLIMPHIEIGAGCYQYSCSASVVMITVFGSTYTCTEKGQIIDVDVTHSGFTHRGSLICPSCVDICYDDFKNCPEAAALFPDLVNPTESTTMALTSPETSTLATPSSGRVSLASPFLAMVAVLVTALTLMQ